MGYISANTSDMRLPLKNLIEPRIKIDIYDEQTDLFIDTITGGITGGSLSINGESDVRWTFSLNVIPNRQFDIRIQENNYIWIDKYIRVYLGMYSPVRIRKQEMNYYPVGKYYPMQGSITYDATNTQLSISCSDQVANLDGSRNGQYGALNTIFPAYYDTRFYSDSVSYTDNVYSCSIISYTDTYAIGDIFCLKLPETNQEGCSVNINGLGTLPVYSKIVGYAIAAGSLEGNKEYLFQVMYNTRTNSKYFTCVGECEDESIVAEGTGSETIFYLTYHRIRDAVITVLKQLARIKEDDFFVDNVGEYKAMPGYPTYLEYREETPLWDTIPFDQEFGVGSTIWQIIATFRDLYPNYEAYFNNQGQFIMQMIPDCENDPISFYNDYMKKIYISENTTVDISKVRNVSLVYGKSIETQFFANAGVTYSGGVYSTTISGYDEGYLNGDLVALRIPYANVGACYLNINGYGNIPIWDDNHEVPITEPVMEDDTVYVFKIKKKRENKQDIVRAYLLGHWQASGLCALVSGEKNSQMYTTFDGRQVPVYSEEYFMDVYNCEHVVLAALPDSPFTCEKIGVRLGVYSGGEFENIDSDTDAIERAKWETYKTVRLTDSISLQTKLVPFVNDVNFKVQYQPFNEDTAHEYLVTSISHDFYGGTTSWNLVRFYEYYIPEGSGGDDDPGDHYIWNTVKQYNWYQLSTYTWDEVHDN